MDFKAVLISAGVSPTQAKLFAEPLKAAMALFDIDTPHRKAAFLGQCIVESAGFSKLEENLMYTTPERLRAVWPSKFKNIESARAYTRSPEKLANYVYANRNGNGDEASGDGWRFRGSGVLQLTGRANFARAGHGCGRPYEAQPELVRQPSDACLSAAFYFADNGGNALADDRNILAITKMVNGPAALHAQERLDVTNNLYDGLLA